MLIHSILGSKAVAHGNALFGLENFVQSRATRSAYGIVCGTPYNIFDREHQRRQHKLYTDVKGILRVDGKFDIIVSKVSAVGTQ